MCDGEMGGRRIKDQVRPSFRTFLACISRPGLPEEPNFIPNHEATLFPLWRFYFQCRAPLQGR